MGSEKEGGRGRREGKKKKEGGLEVEHFVVVCRFVVSSFIPLRSISLFSVGRVVHSWGDGE